MVILETRENEKGRKIKRRKVRKQTNLMFVFVFVFFLILGFFVFKSKTVKDKINGSERHIQLFQNCELRRRGREQEREREEELQRKRRAY